MRSGQTFTRHFDLEPRQHELFGLDLGEGPTRRTLMLGFVLFVLWTGGCLLFIGFPNQILFSLYVLPPGLITFYGTQRSKKNDRRWNITRWALMFRYYTKGHRPIINGGRRAATRKEWISFRERLGSKADSIAQLPGFGGLASYLASKEEAVDAPTGPAIPLNARARLYGPDRLYKAHQKFSYQSSRSKEKQR